MSFSSQHLVPAPRPQVWDWHTRPGAISRLTPPFMPMTPHSEAENLATGTTVFRLPAGLKWVSRHDLTRYQPEISFSDICLNSPVRQLAQWRHDHHFADGTQPNTTLITDTVHTRAPANLLRSVFAYRQQQLISDLSFLTSLRLVDGSATTKPTKSLTIAITGAHGSVGRNLKAQLTTAGHTVIELVRGTTTTGQRHWNTDYPSVHLLAGVDVLVHLAGEPIFGRFNEAHKKEIRDSRVNPTYKLSRLVAESASVTTMVCASAIGIYGPDRSAEKLTESSDRGDGFLADVVTDWEHACHPAADAGKRVVNIRTGVALSGNSGLLPLLKTLFSTGLGGSFGDGNFWFSWIAMDDLTDIYTRAIVDHRISGAVNATAPEPVLNKDMAKALGTELNRPTLLPIPTFGPKLLLGKEGAHELALADQRVSSAKIRQLGHNFRFSTIEAALAHELGGEQLQDSSAYL
ncbi:TIGR01777 family protein [Corynebacterium pseudodiphtheriticum]|nr:MULTISPECIES: TIGR01777 family oxidoreductase [Corynebacterium]ERS38425.1 TIGR01777 family protein [Corynebacterium sp. KPL1995]ERS71765.1 TIGR01777 family protein [Corynebacterium sp. KPL1989]MDK4304503.1 TIGR01777 family oxidoreductase [Corynebacterium pseudodiphtheriticum]MDK8683027.1 TIGR01777 family oxidoreductase [Corynebacterium pseudodiphtheriticum]MDK8804947.1 TIGR01777 family oxidoreductase [Corynebacterium pseudodiphtheriticum]